MQPRQWIKVAGRTKKKGTHSRAACLEYTEPGHEQTERQTILIYKTLSVIYFQYVHMYLSIQSFLSTSNNLFIHFPLITPAMCRSVPPSPFRAPFHLIQQHHFSGFHEGDSSIRRHSSSNYPFLTEEHTLSDGNGEMQ